MQTIVTLLFLWKKKKKRNWLYHHRVNLVISDNIILDAGKGAGAVHSCESHHGFAFWHCPSEGLLGRFSLHFPQGAVRSDTGISMKQTSEVWIWDQFRLQQCSCLDVMMKLTASSDKDKSIPFTTRAPHYLSKSWTPHLCTPQELLSINICFQMLHTGHLLAELPLFSIPYFGFVSSFLFWKVLSRLQSQDSLLFSVSVLIKALWPTVTCEIPFSNLAVLWGLYAFTLDSVQNIPFWRYF